MGHRRLQLVIILLVSLLVCLTGCVGKPKELSGEEIYKKISPITVEVYAEGDFVSSLGSGFFIDENGTVVTNFHVIEDCSSAYVTTSDGGVYDVTSVLGYSKHLSDIAILSTTKSNSSAAESASSVVTGEAVYVLGSSLGLTGTFSEGLVSSAEREIDGRSYFQISAPISEGNSGGPVVNSYGQVIGIASAGFEDGQNLNLAIPVACLDRISTDKPISMEEFYETTSCYSRVVVHGETLAVRTITLRSLSGAKMRLYLYESDGITEKSMISLMDSLGSDPGGGQLYIIDPGFFVEEIDAWCFAPERKPGDYAIIETPEGYSLVYISMFN